MSAVRELTWFAKHSWTYLGCDRGTGRWQARSRYLSGFVRAARAFLRSARADRAAVQDPPRRDGT